MGPGCEGPDFDGPDFDGPDFDGPDFDGTDFDRPDFDGPDFTMAPHAPWNSLPIELKNCSGVAGVPAYVLCSLYYIII